MFKKRIWYKEEESYQEFDHIFRRILFDFKYFYVFDNIRIVRYAGQSNVNFFYSRNLHYPFINEKDFAHNIKNKIIRFIIDSIYTLLNFIIQKQIQVPDITNNFYYYEKYPFIGELFPDYIRDCKINKILGK